MYDDFKCPCGRSESCLSATSSQEHSATPVSTPGISSPGQSPSAPSIGPGQSDSDDIPRSWGDLTEDTGETNSPEEILEDAQAHDWDHCFALMSGGYDSLVATHYTYHNAGFPIDGIIHVDTSVGLRETTEYVKERADDLGLPVYIADTRRHEDEYTTRVETYGFPGSTREAHKWEYINNKDKPLQKLLQQFDGNSLLISGASRMESKARWDSVSADGIELKDSGDLYASPIASWTKKDVREYIDDHGIPRSGVVDTLTHSGDCLCGAFATRWFELEMLHENYPYMWQYIQSLEARVIDSARNGNMKKDSYTDYVLWGHGSTTDRELDQRLGRREKTLSQWACGSSCEPFDPGVTSGNTYQTLTEAALQFVDDEDLPDSETLFRDAFDVTQAIPDDCDEHDLDVLKRGYEALDAVAERLGYEDHKEMVEDRAESKVE